MLSRACEWLRNKMRVKNNGRGCFQCSNRWLKMCTSCRQTKTLKWGANRATTDFNSAKKSSSTKYAFSVTWIRLLHVASRLSFESVCKTRPEKTDIIQLKKKSPWGFLWYYKNRFVGWTCWVRYFDHPELPAMVATTSKSACRLWKLWLTRGLRSCTYNLISIFQHCLWSRWSARGDFNICSLDIIQCCDYTNSVNIYQNHLFGVRGALEVRCAIFENQLAAVLDVHACNNGIPKTTEKTIRASKVREAAIPACALFITGR